MPFWKYCKKLKQTGLIGEYWWMTRVSFKQTCPTWKGPPIHPPQKSALKMVLRVKWIISIMETGAVRVVLEEVLALPGAGWEDWLYAWLYGFCSSLSRVPSILLSAPSAWVWAVRASSRASCGLRVVPGGVRSSGVGTSESLVLGRLMGPGELWTRVLE